MLKSIDRKLTTLILKVVPLWCKPNYITWSRILLIPSIWWLYYYVSPWAATGMFAFVAMTDYVDGRLARGRGMVTFRGMLFDIGCDLTLVWSTFWLLCRDGVIGMQGQSSLSWVMALLVGLMLAREFIVFGTKKFYRVRRSDVEVFMLGKCKTAFIMFSLVVLLTSKVSAYSTSVGAALLAIAAVCSFLSGIQYLQLFRYQRSRWARW